MAEKTGNQKNAENQSNTGVKVNAKELQKLREMTGKPDKIGKMTGVELQDRYMQEERREREWCETLSSLTRRTAILRARLEKLDRNSIDTCIYTSDETSDVLLGIEDRLRRTQKAMDDEFYEMMSPDPKGPLRFTYSKQIVAELEGMLTAAWQALDMLEQAEKYPTIYLGCQTLDATLQEIKMMMKVVHYCNYRAMEVRVEEVRDAGSSLSSLRYNTSAHKNQLIAEIENNGKNRFGVIKRESFIKALNSWLMDCNRKEYNVHIGNQLTYGDEVAVTTTEKWYTDKLDDIKRGSFQPRTLRIDYERLTTAVADDLKVIPQEAEFPGKASTLYFSNALLAHYGGQVCQHFFVQERYNLEELSACYLAAFDQLYPDWVLLVETEGGRGTVINFERRELTVNLWQEDFPLSYEEACAVLIAWVLLPAEAYIKSWPTRNFGLVSTDNGSNNLMYALQNAAEDAYLGYYGTYNRDQLVGYGLAAWHDQDYHDIIRHIATLLRCDTSKNKDKIGKRAVRVANEIFYLTGDIINYGAVSIQADMEKIWQAIKAYQARRDVSIDEVMRGLIMMFK